MRNMARKAKDSTKNLRGVGNAANTAGRNMRNMSNAAGTSGKNLRKLGSDATFADRRLHRLARRMRNMQTIRLGMGGALTGLGTGMVTRQIGKTIIDYDKAMRMIEANMMSHQDSKGRTILKGLSTFKQSAAMMKQLDAKVAEVAQKSIFSPTEVAGGLLELARAGVTAKDSLDMLHPVMRLAGAAGDISASKAADIATNITMSFGGDLAKTTDTVDILAAAASDANTNILQISEAMKMAAPSAFTAGRGLKEVTATLMVMASRNFKGGMAGVTVARMIDSIYKRTGPAVKALKGIGLAHKDFMGKDGNTIPITEMLDKFKEAAKVVGREKVIQAINTMMGTRGGRGGKLLFENADEIRKKAVWLERSQNRAMLMERVMMSGIYGAYEKMRASVYESILSLGKGGLADDMTYLADTVRSLANSFSQLNPSTKKWIGRALLLATAISAIIIPLGIFMWALGALIPIFSLLLSPITLVVVGLATLASWLMHKYDFQFDEKTISSIADKFGGLAISVKDFGNSISQKWDTSELKTMFDYISGQMTSLTNKLKEKLPSVLSAIASDNPLVRMFRGALDLVTEIISTIAKIPDYILNPSKALKDFAKFNYDTAQGVGDKAASFTKKVGSWLPDLSVSKSAKEVVTGKTIAKTQADKERSLKVQTDNQVTIDAPGTIILKLPDGTVAGRIPLKSSVVSKGVTTPDAVGP